MDSNETSAIFPEFNEDSPSAESPDLIASRADSISPDKIPVLSTTADIGSAIADACQDQENARQSTSGLTFVSRVRELSVESLFEFARPFLTQSSRNSTATLTDHNREDNAVSVSSSPSFGPIVEDYFKSLQNPRVSAGAVAMTRKDLEKAIDSLKEQILTLPPDTDHEKRATMVQELILFRLRLQELEDEGEKPSGILSMGHELQRSPLFRPRDKLGRHCEVCGQLMLFTPSQMECRKCGYVCHERCVATIPRSCVAEQVDEKPEYIMDIRREKGLATQNFACAECRKPFPMDSTNVWDVHIRICDYNGKYYCTICHRNELEIIPARVIKNWDLTQHQVSRASKQILNLLFFFPIIPALEINKELLVHVEDFSIVEDLRNRLAILHRMMLDCREAPQIVLLRKLPAHRKHLMNKNGLYSLNDLLDIDNGSLAKDLGGFVGELERHVKVSCSSCMKLLHLCMYCFKHDDKIYAFDERARVCPQCGKVAHKTCARTGGECPNCLDNRNK